MLTAALDRTVDFVVAGFASWTVIAHLSFLADWDRDPTTALWIATLPVVLAFVVVGGRANPMRLRRVALPRDPRSLGRIGAWIGAVAVMAFVMSRWRLTRSAWPPTWVALVALVGAGLWFVVQACRGHAREPDVAPPGHGEGTLDHDETLVTGAPRAPGAVAVALILAVTAGLAVMSAFTVRTEIDDVFVLNRATYIEQHDGPFPDRDTIFADQVFRQTRTAVPQTTIEPLYGSIAALAPISATTLAHLVASPFISALGVLALWRLLRTFGFVQPAIATTMTYLFFLWDGQSDTNIGNNNWSRAHLGKTALLIVVVPFLWHHGLRWARDGERRSLWLLVAGGIAAIGLSTTGAFVAPLVAALAVGAGVAGTTLGSGSDVVIGTLRERALPAALAVVYPLGAALAREVADPSPLVVGRFVLAQIGDAGASFSAQNLSAFTFYSAFGNGPAAFVTISATILGWLWVRDASARFALAGSVAVVIGLVLFPGVLTAADDAAGADAVIWRVMWVLPVGAAVGMMLASPLAALGGDLRLPAQRLVAGAGTVGVGVLLAVTAVVGTPSVSRFNVAEWDFPRRDLLAVETPAAETLISLTAPEGIAATPWRVGYPLAVLSGEVHATNPLVRYVEGPLANVPAFHAAERRLVTDALTWGLAEGERESFAAALDTLEVDSACQYVADPLFEAPPPEPRNRDETTAVLLGAGFERVQVDQICTFWTRG
ncbi:MAG: DUF6077 domain-containing protein [Acidimicrobiales bacterium]